MKRGRRGVTYGLFALALGWPALASAQTETELRLATEMGGDTNVRRTFIQEGVQAAGLVNVLAGGKVRHAKGLFELSGGYDLGGRIFLSLVDESTFAHMGVIHLALWPAESLRLGLEGQAKQHTGGGRRYVDLRSIFSVDSGFASAWELGAYLTPHRFIYYDAFEYTFSALEAGARGRYRLAEKHSLSAFSELGRRHHPSPQRIAGGGWGTFQWRESLFLAGAAYQFSGPARFKAQYVYSQLHSNSFGESIARHRLTASGAFRLMPRTTLLLQGAVQLASYRDEVFLPSDIFLLDEEAHNSASVTVSRALGKSLYLDVQAATYYTHLPSSDSTYFRFVGTVGLSWEMRSRE
jgi:hypothetical protein